MTTSQEWALFAFGAHGDGWLMDASLGFLQSQDCGGCGYEDIFWAPSHPKQPMGLRVWEGVIRYSGDGEGVSYLGEWRRASAAEVIRFTRGVAVTPASSPSVTNATTRAADVGDEDSAFPDEEP